MEILQGPEIQASLTLLPTHHPPSLCVALSLATGSGAKALLDHNCATVTPKRDMAHRWWHSLSRLRWQGFVVRNCVRERKLGNRFATAGFSCQVRKCDVGRLQCERRLES